MPDPRRTSEAATGERWDAIVIGAGPAGCLAALNLARAGRRVLLVDRARFPRHKVCGCCLNEAALAILDGDGLGSIIRALPSRRLDSLALTRRRTVATFPTRPGLAIERAAMDAALADAARRSGADFRHGVAAIVGGWDGAARRVILTGPRGESVAFAPVVICADGLAGSSLRALPEFAVRVRPASRMGLGAIVRAAAAPSNAIHMACAASGYVGWVDLGDGTASVAAAADAAFVRESRGPGPAVERLWSETGATDHPSIDGADWFGAPELSRTRSRVEGPGLFIIGDAAGYVEPFTGEGMSWALWAGREAATLAAAQRPQPGEWTRRFRAGLAARHRRCAVVSSLLRTPRLMDICVHAAASWPAIARAAAARFGAPFRTPVPDPAT